MNRFLPPIGAHCRLKDHLFLTNRFSKGQAKWPASVRCSRKGRGKLNESIEPGIVVLRRLRLRKERAFGSA